MPRRIKYKTCKRYNDTGHAHSLTFTCFHRIKLLNRDRSRQWLIDAISQARRAHQFHLWAYVIMPDHVHLLLWPTRDTYSIGHMLHDIKKPVSLAAIAWLKEHAPSFLSQIEDVQPNGKRHYRFWQRGGGYDRNILKPDVVHHEIAYLHMNPVRRRLVERPIDWRWSSARRHEGLDEGPIELNLESLPPIV